MSLFTWIPDPVLVVIVVFGLVCLLALIVGVAFGLVAREADDAADRQWRELEDVWRLP